MFGVKQHLIPRAVVKKNVIALNIFFKDQLELFYILFNRLSIKHSMIWENRKR